MFRDLVIFTFGNYHKVCDCTMIRDEYEPMVGSIDTYRLYNNKKHGEYIEKCVEIEDLCNIYHYFNGKINSLSYNIEYNPNLKCNVVSAIYKINSNRYVFILEFKEDGGLHLK